MRVPRACGDEPATRRARSAAARVSRACEDEPSCDMFPRMRGRTDATAIEAVDSRKATCDPMRQQWAVLPVSRVVPGRFGSRPWLGLASDLAGNRHVRSWPVRGKHGHEAECPSVALSRGRTPAMTVRVLVVDDEPDVETLFRQQFRREIREGLYTLDFALSALGALAILDDASGEKIILLVSDINMPGMSGLDLIPEVKVRRPNLPVFMISDYDDAERVKTALARGADGFLTKPVDFPKLKQDIMAVMADATGGNG
jgi:CheY-like chemotaxis protein